MNNLIIPKGTHIVLLNDVKVINEVKLHPKGSVGVIDIQPLDAFHAYKIKFNDGSLGMASRREFAIKKHFQNDESGVSHQMNNFEMFDFVIYKCIVGSRAFGLDDENSDTDYRGVYLPSANAHWSMFGIPEQIENKDTEECYWELQKFIVLALKANPGILECLYSPLIEELHPIMKPILDMKQSFLSKLIYQTYNGYVQSQFKKLNQDMAAGRKIKLKNAMHLIRLLLQGIDIMNTQEMHMKVVNFRDNLVDIKFGRMNWDQTNEWRVKLHKEFEEAYVNTKLRERPDHEAANNLLIEARRFRVMEDLKLL